MQCSHRACQPSSDRLDLYFWVLCVAVFGGYVTEPLAAHDPVDGKTHAHAHDDKTWATGLRLPDIEGPQPWSGKPALDDPNRFSIAIMTDRTGGHRPGIWMQAVQRINWMRPDFVVSVGDLIEGYTENEAQIQSQWTEFLSFIDELEMKFFFVAGNHDLSNAKMHDIWREKFGPEWYSFDYRGVHFLCLSSEDPESKIGDEQLAWIKQDLDAARDARWTLVFLHKPLWVYAERDLAAGNDDPTNWKKVEQLLRDRDHTVFAGHVHNYVQYDRNGQNYYSLATTGGGSRLRGVRYGEFDHITWLTMEEDGPRVANLLLDGILPADAVTESEIQKFSKFVEQVRLEASPIFVEQDQLQRGRIRFELQNGYDRDVSVEAAIKGLPLLGLNLEEENISLKAGAQANEARTIAFEFREPVDLKRFQNTCVEAVIETTDGGDLSTALTIPILICGRYTLQPGNVSVDGRFDEWLGGEMPNSTEGMVVDPGNHWKGATDASVKLSACLGDAALFVRAEVLDDQVIEGDQLVVAVDPRPLRGRARRNQLNEETIAAIVEAPTSATAEPVRIVAYNRTEPTPGMRAAGRRTENGYVLEIALPLDQVFKSQAQDWTSIQLGSRLRDVDLKGEPPAEILWNASANLFANRDYLHVFRQ